MKAWKWGALVVCSGVSLVQLYWAFESDVKIPRNTTLVLTQAQGHSLVIDVPTENYAKALSDFTLRTEVRNLYGDLINKTDAIQYETNMKYKFVTDKELPRGRYEARLIVGYRLNPMRRSDLNFPLAIIYVEAPYDNR